MAGARMQLRFLVVATMTCLLAGPCRADQPKAKVHRMPPRAVATPSTGSGTRRAVATGANASHASAVASVTGQLTITAQNSTLGDILRAVRNQTGAAVDVPANATERVVGNFGPGPARDVLSSLLNGSHFNYVLLGSATNPDALEHVILIVKSSAAEQPAAPPADRICHPARPGQQSDMTIDDQRPTSWNANGYVCRRSRKPDRAIRRQILSAARARPDAGADVAGHATSTGVQQQIQQRQQQMGVPPRPAKSARIPHAVPWSAAADRSPAVSGSKPPAGPSPGSA